MAFLERRTGPAAQTMQQARRSAGQPMLKVNFLRARMALRFVQIVCGVWCVARVECGVYPQCGAGVFQALGVPS